MTAYDDRRQWPGTVPPVVGAVPRRPGSVRRTTSVDIVRPDGFGGPLVVSGAGRDLRTLIDQRDPEVVAVGATQVTVDYLGDRRVVAVEATPDPGGLDVLVGARAGSGFRRTMAEALPDLVRSGTLVHQLLDDLTPAVLISGSSLAREGLVRLAADTASTGPKAPTDICAGWQAGGAMFGAIAETGVPLLGWGPPAPALEGDDPWAWHAVTALPAGSMRRRRLIDLGPAPDPDAAHLVVQVHFRDSYWEPDLTETVVHEYRVEAEVDPATWHVLGAAAVPGPLPAPECPSAAASADRLAGVAVGELRAVVRDAFTGTTTCTHLNDVFRSLADLAVLGSSLPRRP